MKTSPVRHQLIDQAEPLMYLGRGYVVRSSPWKAYSAHRQPQYWELLAIVAQIREELLNHEPDP